MGVSVENDKYRFRIDHLRSTGAHVKFLSLEPCWVHCRLSTFGHRLGHRRRRVRSQREADGSAWVTDIRDQCRWAKVPFFFKQWGGKNKKQAGRASKVAPGMRCRLLAPRLGGAGAQSKSHW